MGEEKRKELNDLNLLDKFLFDEAVAVPGFLEDVLSIILEQDVEFEHPPQSEREVRRGTRTREVKLDVWAEDTKGTIYDAEVQQYDRGNLPKRFRLYHALIASKLLPKGIKDFNRLNDVIVIIIAPFDLFGEGRFRYTFHMSCEETPGLKLNDGMTTVFLNTQGNIKDGVSDELIELLHYFEQTTEEMARASNSVRIRGIQEQIQRIRNDEEVGVRYMNRWEEDMELREKTREEVLAELVDDGVLELSEAAKRVGLSEAEFCTRTGLQQDKHQGLNCTDIQTR